MRYERSTPAERPKGARPAPGWRRPLPLSLAAVALAGTGVAAGVASSGHSGPNVEHGAAAAAVATAFVQANVLTQNLGAPPPSGVTDPSWVVRPDPLVPGTGSRGARLAMAEHAWVGPDGSVALLGPAEGARLRADQAGAIRRLFTGPARREQLAELDTLVTGEQRPPGTPVSPGGARVARWYSLHVTGSVAHVEALVDQWERHDTVVGPPGSQRVVGSITTDSVDAAATLVRAGGQWKVSSLSLSPWQQPT